MSQNKSTNKAPLSLKFTLITLLIINAILCFIILNVLRLILSDDFADYKTTFLGSFAIMMLLSIATGDFPSRFGYAIPKNRKIRRYIVSFIGVCLSISLFIFAQPEYHSCNGTMENFKFIKIRNQTKPFITIQCQSGETLTKMIALHNKDKLEPIFERAKNNKTKIEIVYNDMRGLRGLIISDTILKDPVLSKKQDESFPTAFLTASIFIFILGWINAKIKRIGYKYYLKPMNEKERNGSDKNSD